MRLITDILEYNAGVYADKTALVEREPAKGSRRELSWNEFNQQANRMAHFLAASGVKKGDRVVQLMMNCLEWLPIYFGILRSGAWAVPLNFRFTADEVRYCTDIAEAKVIIFGEEFIERIDAVQPQLSDSVWIFLFIGPSEQCPAYARLFHDAVRDAALHTPDIPLDPRDAAALYFTSGTTGKPKAVLHTHQNLAVSAEVENRHHEIMHDDNFLCIPPLYHTGAKMHWFGNLLVGAKSVILKGVKPHWILEAVSEEQVTVVWLLVPWAHDILIAVENGTVRLTDYRLAQWRLMHIGAQPVPPSLVQNWLKVFPHHRYDTNYGLTEAAGPGCVHLGMDNLHKVGAIGIPGFQWECRIVDEQLAELPPETPGELAVRGPCVMREYYKNPEATAATLVNGWLLTGDIARMDTDGFIWLVDRKKDVIITGGENIFPVEIENFIMTHEGIQDVGVIGIPDKRLGEIVAAIIQPKPHRRLDEEEMFEFFKSLPRFKRPRQIFFGEVPRNPTGKIEKPQLRRRYAANSAGDENAAA